MPLRSANTFSALALLIVLSAPLNAADKTAELKSALKDQHGLEADWWIYNDIALARVEARRENKPLFVTFRCVPCKDCKAFDAEVATGSDVIEDLAREHFIPIRQVEMKGVDLSQFQFDHDLNWAAMFINADGTVYARYGTQSAAGPDAYNSIEGLRNTMLRVLELHKNYPANAAELKDKRGADKPYKTALDMPGLRNKEKFAAATASNNCIHCHNIHDAENQHLQDTGRLNHDALWRYPLPDNIGLTIDPKSGIRISAVEPGSPAARAGLTPGEDITHVNGQAIASIADMQWVLDDVPNDAARITVTTNKAGEHAVAVARGWKVTDFSWRGSLWSLPPKLNVWMPELAADKRRQLDLPADQTPLEVRWINRGEPAGRAAFDSGLREGDIVVALAGRPLKEMNTQKFNMHVKLNYKVGDELPLTVLRNGEKRELNIKLSD
jgi:hypothetical protein